MTTEVETRTGRCSTHGTVDATRQLPKIQFPFVVFAVRRSLAKRHPFRCPSCGAPVETY